jgi:hypothetical protein
MKQIPQNPYSVSILFSLSQFSSATKQPNKERKIHRIFKKKNHFPLVIDFKSSLTLRASSTFDRVLEEASLLPRFVCLGFVSK